ncbi:MAG: LysM peptidoglycan-binding domain-containing protein [Chloroflexi bacterium]|nr:LysM peptidoglycan-binding domain-containing protein [Chloroflexota bacterium]
MEKKYPALLMLCLLLAACHLTAAPVSPTAPSAAPSPSSASLSCTQLVEQVLDTVGAACGELGRNQLCYGHRLIEVEWQPGASASFTTAGDRADLLEVVQLSAAPLDENAQTWGIVLFKAQANLPDTLPGQNVTFVLFGDTRIDGLAPDMQAVTLRTGIGQTTCTDAPPNGLLLQSPENTQVSLNINGAILTLGSTLYVSAVENGEMLVATLEGAGVISAYGSARVIQAGAQTRLPLGGVSGLEVIGPPAEPEPFDATTLARTPLSLLERAISLPEPLSLRGNSTPTPSAGRSAPFITQTPANCVPRADWTATYTVQRGDTLSVIARRYGIGLQALQEGNCITNPDRIAAGQELRVPQQATVAPTAAGITAPAIVFSVDSTYLAPGACTTLRWNAAGAREVYLEDEPVDAANTREVCPSQRATYTLLVIQADGSQTPYTVTVDIQQPTSTPMCGNQICEVGENGQNCPRDCG